MKLLDRWLMILEDREADLKKKIEKLERFNANSLPWVRSLLAENIELQIIAHNRVAELKKQRMS